MRPSVVLLAFLVAACAAGRGRSGTPVDLWETEWRLESIGGAPVFDGSAATLVFPEKGRVAGNGSCNRFTGTVRVSGEAIEIGPLAATRMACAEPVGGQEARYLAALQRAERFAVDGERLSIWTAGTDEPLRFVRTRR